MAVLTINEAREVCTLEKWIQADRTFAYFWNLNVTYIFWSGPYILLLGPLGFGLLCFSVKAGAVAVLNVLSMAGLSDSFSAIWTLSTRGQPGGAYREGQEWKTLLGSGT